MRTDFWSKSDFAVLYASSVIGIPFLRALLSFLYLVVNVIPVVVINSCYQPLFSLLACHISSESCIVILAMTPLGQVRRGIIAKNKKLGEVDLVTRVANRLIVGRVNSQEDFINRAKANGKVQHIAEEVETPRVMELKLSLRARERVLSRLLR